MSVFILILLQCFALIHLSVLRSLQKNIMTNGVMGLQSIQFLRSYSYSDATGFGNNFDRQFRIYFCYFLCIFLCLLLSSLEPYPYES